MLRSTEGVFTQALCFASRVEKSQIADIQRQQIGDGFYAADHVCC